MKRYLDAANLITSAALACGFAALVLAAGDSFVAAAVAIVVAAILDGLDGLVARVQRTAGRFGTNLDSLADVVAFGAAPALLLARGTLEDGRVLGTAAAVMFLVAGAWRLARFAIVEDRLRWIGLPIPTAGILLAAAVAAGLAVWPLVALALALSALMVSEIAFPTAAGLRERHRRRRTRTDAVEPPPVDLRPDRRAAEPPPVSVAAAPRRD